MQKQTNGYTNNFLSPQLCGYGWGFSTQLVLLSLIEKSKKVLNSKGFGRAVCIAGFVQSIQYNKTKPLIAKLHLDGFNKSSLILLFSYLNNT